MIKAVIFDLDNTIYDYDACNSYAVEKLKKYCRNTYQLSGSEFLTMYEKSKMEVKQRLGNTAASHNRMLYAQKFLESLSIKPASAIELYDTYWNAVLEHMELYEYVLPLFQKLSDMKIRIALLTDLTAHIQHRKIKKLGIGSFIDVLVTSEEAGCEKPDPAVFKLVLEKLGLSPEEAVMVGDSQSRDIDGALIAGMPAVRYSRDQNLMVSQCLEVIKSESGKE